MAIEYKPVPEPEGTNPLAWIRNFKTIWENWKLARLASEAQYYTSLIPANRTFAQLVASIGSDTATIWVNSTVTISANLPVPSNISIAVLKGGGFSIASGVTLTIAIGKIVAGDFTVFTGAGTVAGLQEVNAMWFGATDDGVDSTAAILTASTGGAKQIIIPRGVKFHIKTLLQSLPDTVVIEDKSVINDFSAPNETAKSTGILSSDTAEKDTHYRIANGHHAIIQLNNFGTSGTVSGHEGKGSIIWCRGQFALGAANKRGYRGVLIDQYTAETGGDHFRHVERSIAPWVAARAEYEFWASGQVVAVGDFRFGATEIYVASSAGTSTVEPTHLTGTVTGADGIAWTWVQSSDSTIWAVDEYSRVLFGQGSGGETFRHKVGITDLGSNYAWWAAGQTIAGAGTFRRWGNNAYVSTGAMTTAVPPPTHTVGTVGGWAYSHGSSASYTMNLASRGPNRRVLIQLNPTDAGGTEVLTPYLDAEATEGTRIMKSDGSTSLAVFHDTDGFTVAGLNLRGAEADDGDTTPNVSGISTLYLANTTPTSITGLDNGAGGTGINDQLVFLTFTNDNTTLVHSDFFMLEGFQNVTPGTYSTIAFKKVQNTYSDRWVEVFRKLNPVLGSSAQVIASEATNDNPTEIVFQNRVATTDATVTTLHTFTVPTLTTYAIEAMVIARRTGGAAGTAEDGARYKLSAVYKNVAGTATIIGAPTIAADEDQAAWDCTFSPTGATVRIRVTGAADNGVTWHMTARVYPLST